MTEKEIASLWLEFEYDTFFEFEVFKQFVKDMKVTTREEFIKKTGAK